MKLHTQESFLRTVSVAAQRANWLSLLVSAGCELFFSVPPDKEQEALKIGAMHDKTAGLWMAPDEACAAMLQSMGCTANLGSQAASTSAAKPATAPSTPQREAATVEQNDETLLQQPAAATPSPTPRKKRTYFEVNFNERQEAKAMGARWDGDTKQWYAASDTVAQRLATCFTAATPASARKFFAVKFADKDRARHLGGKWDSKHKLWCVLPTRSGMLHTFFLRRAALYTHQLHACCANQSRLIPRAVSLLPTVCWCGYAVVYYIQHFMHEEAPATTPLQVCIN